MTLSVAVAHRTMSNASADLKNDERFMRRCIELAAMAGERGDSPVGCVLVSGGEVVASGIEASRAKRDVTCHAEIEAIREASAARGSQDLSDCTLYTTHEPCVMCAYVIRYARIPRVIFGVASGALGGAGGRYALLLDASIAGWGDPPVVVRGVLGEECVAAPIRSRRGPP